jgi:hypothetical protein
MRFVFFMVFFLIYWQQTVYAAGPPWKFTISEGETEASIGFLVQPQFEMLENDAGKDYTNSLFVRRFRLIAGGRITSKLSFFIESGSANLGKRKPDGRRRADIYLQDAYVNYAFRPEFQLTGGMLLTPVSHNSGQSSVSLLPIDFGPYSFLASGPTRSKNGRDYGLQARGYIKKHFEYRVGVYRGNADHNGAFPYRYLARFVWYPFESLPKQNTWLLEGSYYLRRAKLGPFVQIASRDYVRPDSSDDMKLQGGAAYWIFQHQMNIKAGISRLLKTGSPDRTQFVIQAQFLYY